ncbi:tRNA-intron lyase [Natronobacterium gregoryi]|uniref:tRNA-splicing endonuclease n=2 Tax=Natronobacterium gregoryi TaxID=44930 RepID=L0AF84_NATGS|nr:tRNA-intron lyase [Natronobacterium gregoryi]AFZ72573.1 tRNA intron endonuclease [Natronobacterium gregoryi SP2]ELY71908.1 tRNA splicing endonuclease [Natronobacterium gregoryi SP2]PLK19346.1 tRNA-intron lyase [Natronobacterium gregoryi SP2]SFJ52308.1 tRNA-intron endonuclease [Natronobacterium gregoryi]
MSLEGRFDEETGVVTVGSDARQRYHDSRGYGYPTSGNEIALSPVEAAHLLYRGDLEAVVGEDGDRLDFQSFVAQEPGEAFGVRFLVYADLRERGFYLSPAAEPWIDEPPVGEVDFAVFPRGKGPGDGEVAYALRVLGERTDVPASELSAGVLAVVDEESEITYFEVDRRDPTGSSDADVTVSGRCEADLLEDRVVVWDPPVELYERTFYGQPLEGREYDEPTLQCSLLEAASLAAEGAIALEPSTVRERGREVEGERFDRRLTVYTELRDRGVVPKTGYKFGADFRTYADVESVDDLGHSELLVRVHPADYVFEPRDLALDVRLAHGVRKTMVFALVAGDGTIEWWSLERLTP